MSFLVPEKIILAVRFAVNLAASANFLARNQTFRPICFYVSLLPFSTLEICLFHVTRVMPALSLIFLQTFGFSVNYIRCNNLYFRILSAIE